MKLKRHLLARHRFHGVDEKNVDSFVEEARVEAASEFYRKKRQQLSLANSKEDKDHHDSASDNQREDPAEDGRTENAEDPNKDHEQVCIYISFNLSRKKKARFLTLENFRLIS